MSMFQQTSVPHISFIQYKTFTEHINTQINSPPPPGFEPGSLGDISRWLVHYATNPTFFKMNFYYNIIFQIQNRRVYVMLWLKKWSIFFRPNFKNKTSNFLRHWIVLWLSFVIIFIFSRKFFFSRGNTKSGEKKQFTIWIPDTLKFLNCPVFKWQQCHVLRTNGVHTMLRKLAKELDV